jgi:hypothetical protein
VKIADLESKIGELSSEKAKFQGLRYDIVYAAKEGFKKHLKKANYLKQAVDNLDPESIRELQDMFDQLGFGFKIV